MEIIPVIDLSQGLVVHARRGNRSEYRPLESPLCPSSEPFSVLNGLCRAYDIKTVYIADLDALTGHRPQQDLIEGLSHEFSDLDLWIDCGWPGVPVIPGSNRIAVIGSESLTPGLLDRLSDRVDPWVLSLDFKDGRLLGPESLLDREELWPARVILMQLSRIGSCEGPDFAGAQQFLMRHPKQRFILAGGVRSESDLEQLDELGLEAVLLATALHAGTIQRRRRAAS